MPGRKSGLSPRLRGNLEASNVETALRGSIPASAGEPSGSRAGSDRSRVYPRVCGGTTPTRSHSPDHSGLSPRLRGNHAARCELILEIGSIPASAGEPSTLSAMPSEVTVYPRVCGGTNSTRAAPSRSPGLSPRLRGNRRYSPYASGCRGSIPASAGEPLERPQYPLGVWVYPRGCGGTYPIPPLRERYKGLSPRLRGNRYQARADAAEYGSIPASAGEPPAPARGGR